MIRANQLFVVASMLAIVLAASFALAAPNPVQSSQRDASGVTIKLQSGVLRLEVCDPRTIHVTCAATDNLPEKKEFVVIKQWTPIPFEWRDDGPTLKLGTSRMGAEIDLATGALTLLDDAGKILLQEPSDGGRLLKPNGSEAGEAPTYLAQQTFLCPEDEHLYGMTQGQDGTWNWRGMPIELRQLNTQTAFPVLISSKGYGLLWNNASLTDFNPVDDEIELSTSTQTATTGPVSTEQLPDGRRSAAAACPAHRHLHDPRRRRVRLLRRKTATDAMKSELKLMAK